MESHVSAPGAGPLPDRKTILSKRIESAGWGAFFVWVGVALLIDVGIAVGLLGVGAITLAEQAARKSVGLALEGFWMVVGTLFVVGGLWQLFAVDLPLVPLLLIAAGVVVLLAALMGKN